MATTACLRSSATNAEWKLDNVETVLGRAAACDITLDMQAVSRQHASITRTPHGWRVKDLGSSNGTWLNGTKLPKAGYPLRDGDEIVLAGSISFTFIDPQATPMAPAIGRLTGVWVDPDTRAVWVDAELVEPPLSERQQALLELLETNLGQVVSRQDVVDHVWADVAAEGVSAEAIDALVKRLRSRLRPLQRRGEWLEVVRGRGIRLRDPEV